MAWYEGPMDPFVHTLLLDLRDAVWNLKVERADMRGALADAVLKQEQLKKEASVVKVELEEKKKELIMLLAQKKEKDGVGLQEIKKLKKERFWLLALCFALASAVFILRLG